MEILEEKDWIVSFPLNLEVEKLIEWAKQEMKKAPGNPTVTGEHDTGIWWYAETPNYLKNRLKEITTLNEDQPSSIWEWPVGGPLLKHTDGIGRGASLVTLIKGRFEIFKHDEKSGEIVDSYIYGPGQIIALKNGHQIPHSGRCLDDYRLAICTYAANIDDPFRDYGDMVKRWSEL